MVNYRNTTNGESSNTLADIASVKGGHGFFFKFFIVRISSYF